MPESAKVTPLMYQGVSDCLLGPHDEIRTLDESYGADFEGEFAVITNDVPLGTPAQAMASHLILFSVFNDITYREIIKQEIETKFGFLQSKPNSSFAPFLVTPDELGAFWDGKRINLPLEIYLNGQLFGRPVGREMHFTFPELVAHACRTRPLSAGSIVGTGTVSNEDKAAGFACLTEKRFQEILDTGKAVTPWLKKGDRVRIDCFIQGNQKTESIFGKIDQDVV
jgi:fumarylacetoacetate (FAA) hydrolase